MALATFFFRVVCLCELLLTVGNTLAASFSVEPTRIFLKNSPQIALKVGNAGESEVFVQSELMAWVQQDEKDVYTTSRDILVSPPMFKIPPGGEQTVRVRLMRGDTSKLERAYRLFLQEVPQSQSNQSMVSTTLKMGVPIFIQTEKTDPVQLSWRASRTSDGINIQVNNTSNSHIQFTSLEFSLPNGRVLSDEKVFVYVLPGKSFHWDIKLNQPVQGNHIILKASSDRDEIEAKVDISAADTAP
jgi:fimbrial chaperone protein